MRRPDWSRAFFDPIELPNGRQLATLKDAAKYITSLPASEHDLPHWRAAVAALPVEKRAITNHRVLNEAYDYQKPSMGRNSASWSHF